ncbi:MAG: PAS domain S-box protein [Pseudomonadota bacterium]
MRPQAGALLALAVGAAFAAGMAGERLGFGLTAQLQHHWRGALLLLLVLAILSAMVRAFSASLARRMLRLNERHDLLLQSIDGIVWEAQAQPFRFTFVSAQAERLLGFPAADWLQRGFWLARLHPDDRARAATQGMARGAVAAAQQPVWRVLAADGRTVWLREMRTATGASHQLCGLLLDISAQQQQEERLRRLLNEQATILRNALVGIVHIRHRIIVSCNQRFEAIFGYGEGEMVGRSTDILYATRAIYSDVGIRAYTAFGEDSSFSVELLLRRRDGSTFSGAINGRPIDVAHPQEGSIWIYADISERRQAEAELRKLQRAVEQSPVSTIITSCDGTIEYVNPRFTRVTGYEASEVIGKNARIVQSGETATAIYEELWSTILGGREWHGVLRNRRKNGELFWEEALISPIIDEHGTITHMLAVKEDISERKRIEEALEQYQHHLEDLVRQRTADLGAALDAATVAEKTKDAFLANVSHELRTPLNAVIGFSELALRTSADPKQRVTLEKIAESGQTLLAIINDLLDLTKIAAGQLDFERIAFSPRKTAARVASALSHRAAEKGLALTQDLADDLPEVLLGDPLRIEQILLNLVSNAIKFTDAGRVEMRLATVPGTDGMLTLQLIVADSGIGMTRGEIERIFMPFAQADASITRRYGGTGLGLAICERLAEGMGGAIEVVSVPGQGTTFTARLPVAPGSAAELPAGDERLPFHPGPARYACARVLVVDDQELNREIVFELLSGIGIVPCLAENGEQAIELVRQAGAAGYDLVLMDIQMPVMDGISATRILRASFPCMPIVAMTAHTMAHERAVYLEAGMSDHIGKPFDTAAFFRLVAKWLGPANGAHGAQPAPRAATGIEALPHLDARAALERFGGNAERYRHWLAVFVRDAAGFGATVAALLGGADADAARKAVHAFRGRAGMLGMSQLQQLATQLEAAIGHGPGGSELVAPLAAGIERLLAELRPDCAALAAPCPSLAAAVAGPTPPLVATLLAALANADGASAGMLQGCIEQLGQTPWLPLLEAARFELEQFNFEAAAALLAPSTELDQN